MIISILLIYLIIMCWYGYSWVRTKTWFGIRNNFELVWHFGVVIAFIVLVILFLRVLGIFKEKKTLDLNFVVTSNEFDILMVVLALTLLYSLRRLIFYVFKIYWFKLHYFLLSPYNLKSYEIYGLVYMDYVYRPCYHSYKYLKWINLVATLGLALVVLYDLMANNLVLDVSLWYLKYYSLVKLIYMCSKFITTKQDLLLDFYSYNLMYCGVIDQSAFHMFEHPEHRRMIGEAMKYGNGIIRESKAYTPIARRKMEDMEFFKRFY